MIEQLMISEPYSGLPGIVLGGYTAGRLARALGSSAQVKLRAPVRIGARLELLDVGGTAVLRDGATIVAEATAIGNLDLVPPAVGMAEAREASRAYPGHRAHLFPNCFCCGPERDARTGLRIFPGPVGRRGVVATPWTPAETFADGDGAVPPEILWSAVDCPSIWALACETDPHSEERAVTGGMAVHVLGTAKAGAGYVVVGWPLARDDRELQAGAAVIAEDGEVVCVARQTMILTDRGVPLGLAHWVGARAD